MDTIKNHGSSETVQADVIIYCSILMNEYESVTRYTRGCNNFHTCLYHVLHIRLLIYVPREPGALPFNKKKK
jgi:hypothetical protein